MAGGFETQGFDELAEDLERISRQLTGQGAERALKAGAEPILQQMKANVRNRSFKLQQSLAAGRVKTRRGSGGKYITIGAHKGTPAQEYAGPLEFGHGGPHPAPAHPYIRPAYDAQVDHAYELIKSALKQELK